MAGKVLGIEIGSRVTRVVEMADKGNNPKIYNYCSFETPMEVTEGGNIYASSSFITLLKRNLEVNGIKTNKAIFSVNSSRVAVREALVPIVKQQRIRDMIVANSSEYFPVDLNQYELGANVMGTEEQDGVKKNRLFLSALPKDIIAACEKMATAAGLTLVGVTYAGNSMVDIASNEYVEGVNAYVKIDEGYTTIVISDDDQIKLQRTIKYGVGDVIEMIQESDVYGEDLSFMEAVSVARERNCIRKFLHPHASYTEEDDREEEVAAFRKELTESLEDLLSNIERILSYYMSKNKISALDGVYLMGVGANVSGLARLMSNEYGYPVITMQRIAGVSYTKSSKSEEFYPAEYVSCIRGAMNPIYSVVANQKGKNGAVATGEKQGSLALGGIVFGLCAFVAVALLVVPLLQKITLEAEKSSLQRQVDSYEEEKQTYLEKEQVKQDVKDVAELEELTTSESDKLLDFIEELEKKMPSQCNVVSMSIEENQLGLGIIANNKEAAAKVFVVLREIESIQFANVSCGGDNDISSSRDSYGNEAVSFYVVCTYLAEGSGENVVE